MFSKSTLMHEFKANTAIWIPKTRPINVSIESALERAINNKTNSTLVIAMRI